MNRRPFRVTLTLSLVLFISAWNGLRAWTGFAWRAALAEFSAWPGPWYVIISGAFWLVVGIWLSFYIAKRKPRARTMLLAAAAGYTVWYWCERLFLQTSRENWLFALSANLLLLVVIYFISSVFKRETHERTSKDQKTE